MINQFIEHIKTKLVEGFAVFTAFLLVGILAGTIVLTFILINQ